MPCLSVWCPAALEITCEEAGAGRMLINLAGSWEPQLANMRPANAAKLDFIRKFVMNEWIIYICSG